MEKEYKYDAAFSFLQEDENIVTELDKLLRDRISTFFFPTKQKELSGKDGIEEFSRVFQSDSRLVVVFFRNNWGETKWTRIEETAIKDRGFEEGFDFCVFIVLDKTTVKLPSYYPKSRIWIDIEQYGVKGAAAFIEARLQEEGGIVTPDNAITRAKSIEREIEYRNKRNELQSSPDYNKKSQTEVLLLFDEIRNIAKSINQSSENISMNIKEESNSIELGCYGIFLQINYGIDYNNRDYGLVLVVRYIEMFQNEFHLTDYKELSKDLYKLDLINLNEYGWTKISNREESSNTKNLADALLKNLIKYIEYNLKK